MQAQMIDALALATGVSRSYLRDMDGALRDDLLAQWTAAITDFRFRVRPGVWDTVRVLAHGMQCTRDSSGAIVAFRCTWAGTHLRAAPARIRPSFVDPEHEL